MSTATIDIPATDNTRAMDLARIGKSLAITTQEGAEFATTFIRDAKTYYGEVEALLGPSRDAAHLAHKTITTKIKELIGPVEAEEKGVRLRLGDYQQRIERERLAEERRQQEAAEAAARAEHARLQAEADAKALAEQAHVQALADAEASAIEEALGEAVAPVVVELAPVVVAPVAAKVVTLAAPKINGLSGSTKWDFQLTNESQVPREFCMVDQVKLRRYVTAMGNAKPIPGVRIFQKFTPSVR